MAIAPPRVNVFAGLDLDRNAERRDDVAWLVARHADAGARFLVLDAGGEKARRALFAPAANALRLLDAGEAAALLGIDAPWTYLGDDASGPLFLLLAAPGDDARIAGELGADYLDLRSAGLRLPAFQSGLFAYALAIAHWQGRTRYCSACASPLQVLAGGHRAHCPACGIDHFPRVDPAMIVIVGWKDRCLLGRQPSWGANRWSTLAGFIEPGESLEDAVRREVFEEAGVRVGACEYHSSQPWPFPSSLMLGFVAEAIDPSIQVGSELAEARWFSAGEIVDGLATGALALPPKLSVSHELLAHWLREHAGLELGELVAGDAWAARG